MTELVIHIGTHKTGSTSIQTSLYNSSEFLKSKGVYYPKAKTVWGGHHQLPWGLGVQHPNRKDGVTVETCLKDWLKEGFEKIILSSEDFEFIPRPVIREFAERLKPAKVRVVVYLRDQVSYLISDYKQHVKMSGVRFTGHIDDFYFKYDFERRFNYHALLMPWAKNFGVKALDVRSFYKKNLYMGDVVSDFFYKEGLGEVESKTENVSMSDLQAYASSVMNSKNVPSEIQGKLLASEAWRNYECSVKGYSLLADTKKQYFEERFINSNKKIIEVFGLYVEDFFSTSRRLELTRDDQFEIEKGARIVVEKEL